MSTMIEAMPSCGIIPMQREIQGVPWKEGMMGHYYRLWSTAGIQTFDFSDRLQEQGVIRREDVVDRTGPLYLPEEALDQPTSWSRTGDEPVSLRELIATYYPATARRFSIEPRREKQSSVLRVTQLSDQEFVKVAVARLEHGIHDFEDIPGITFARYPIQLLKNELEFETQEGAQIVGIVAQRLALIETRLAADRVYPKGFS
jgi:hypothetical protein